MASQTSAGSTLSVSAALPATNTEAGFTALTFTEVGSVETIGAFGPSAEQVNFQPLKGPVETHKGAVNYGTVDVQAAYVPGDAGQAIVRAAADPDNNAAIAVKITFQNGDVRYFQGKVFGFPENIGGASNITMVNFTISVNTKVIAVDADD